MNFEILRALSSVFVILTPNQNGRKLRRFSPASISPRPPNPTLPNPKTGCSTIPALSSKWRKREKRIQKQCPKLDSKWIEMDRKFSHLTLTSKWRKKSKTSLVRKLNNIFNKLLCNTLQHFLNMWLMILLSRVPTTVPVTTREWRINQIQSVWDRGSNSLPDDERIFCCAEKSLTKYCENWFLWGDFWRLLFSITQFWQKFHFLTFRVGFFRFFFWKCQILTSFLKVP